MRSTKRAIFGALSGRLTAYGAFASRGASRGDVLHRRQRLYRVVRRSLAALHPEKGTQIAVAERDVLINLRVSRQEREMLHAIADANDEPFAQTVRRWIAKFYRERFGERMPTARSKR